MLADILEIAPLAHHSGFGRELPFLNLIDRANDLRFQLFQIFVRA
jgi:hypothetical protein